MRDIIQDAAMRNPKIIQASQDKPNPIHGVQRADDLRNYFKPLIVSNWSFLVQSFFAQDKLIVEAFMICLK